MDWKTVNWVAVVPQALLGLVFTTIIYRRFFSPIRNIPGPAFASISRFWHIYHIIKGDQNLALIKQHEKHGHFVRIAHNEVSVSHPEGIKKILLSPLQKAPWYKLLAIPDYRFQTPMSTTDPKKKNERSKAWAAGYSLTNNLQNEGAVNDVVELFLGYLDNFAATKQSFNFDEYIAYTAFDIVGELLFSKQFGFLKENRDVGNAIANALALGVYAATMGFYRWVHVIILGNPLMTALGLLPMGHLFDTTVHSLDERLKNPHDSRFDIADHWLRAMEKSKANPDAPKVTLRDVYAMATGVVGAASDTVSTAMQSFVYYMNRHPDAWKRAQAEIDEAIRTQGICQDRVVSFADAQKLPFLQACLKESLRVFGPVPMGLPRLAPKGGLTIGDTHFSEGTILSINPWVMHHSTEIWGPDAKEFNPDRWLAGNTAGLDRYFMPWGLGYASCPGQHIAKIEMSKLGATLVRDYNFCQVDKKQDWQWKAYFTIVQHSWPVYVEKRESSLS